MLIIAVVSITIMVMVVVAGVVAVMIEMKQVEEVADRRTIERHVRIIVIHPGIGQIIAAAVR